MKKPLFLRILGWLTLACIVVPCSVPLMQVLSGIHIKPMVWPGVVICAAVPSFILWCIGSVVHAYTSYKARLMADAMKKAAAQAQTLAAAQKGGPFPR